MLMEDIHPFLSKNFKLSIPIILIIGSILLYGLKSFFRDQSLPLLERIETNQQQIIKIQEDIKYLKEENKRLLEFNWAILQKIYDALKEE